jgi:ribosome-binding factor A
MYKRSEKVGEAIHEIVSELIIKGLKDPRIGFVTITGVKVTDDLRAAKVFFSVVGSEEERLATEKGLNSAARFIRNEVGKNLRMRYVPEILFRYDEAIETGDRIERLLKQIHEEEGNDTGNR